MGRPGVYVCLLRGVNVGGRNKVPMKALAELFESLGHEDVRTLIQSGNVVFSATSKPTPAALESAIGGAFSLTVNVVIRSAAEMRKAVEANPFEDVANVHVAFLSIAPAAAAVRSLEPDTYAPEVFVLSGREIYLYLPNGMGRSRLPAYLDRRLKVGATVRNWNTTAKLSEMASGS